jgi:lambda repressor-like predicted transcriptional regulator
MREEGASLRQIGKEAELSYAAVRKILLRDAES